MTDSLLGRTSLEEIHKVGILKLGTKVAHDEYTVTEYKGGGGSGEVYRLDHPLYGNSRVIKLFIPYYYIRQLAFPGLERSSEDGSITQSIIRASENLYISRNEFRFLSSVDHPFIVKVHAHSAERVDGTAFKNLKAKVGANLTDNRPLPYIIASHVDGQKLDTDFVATSDRSALMAALSGVAHALDYLHTERQLLHCDIKAGNVLVRPDGFPVLVDFALSIDVGSTADAPDDETIVASVDSGYAPPPADEPTVHRALEVLAREGLPRKQVRELLFPHLDRYQFGKLISDSFDAMRNVLAAGELQFVEEMIARLTSWRWLSDHPNISLSNMTDRIDTNRTYPILRVESAGGGIRLPAPTGNIKVAGPLVKFALHPALVRLNRLNQLSLLPARFPGATHTRFLHSLDTYRLTRGLARRLLDNPRFRILFAEEDVRHLLVCSMLHDINHVPLMHVFQESDVDLYRRFDLFNLNLEADFPGSPRLAEVLEEDIGVRRFRRIVTKDWSHQSGEKKDVDQVMSSILNAGLDTDKLSYLRLDSEYSGRGFSSGLDIEGLFEAADIANHVEGDEKGPHLAFRIDALPLLETVVGARLRAFQELYWYGENRAMMASVLHKTRAIAAAGGAEKLKALIKVTATLPDYVVLLELDRLADEHGVGGPAVASFFETYAEQVVSLYSSTAHYDSFSGLNADARTEFDDQIRRAVLAKAGMSGSDALVLVDVPKRPLGVGGRLLVVEGESSVDASSRSDAIKAYKRGFDDLRMRVQLFCSVEVEAGLSNTITSGPAITKWIDSLFVKALSESTFV
ncbi:MAG: hypothetical protein ABR613_13360 [Actinomycetota bacterium]